MYSTYSLFLYWEYCLTFWFLYFQVETQNMVFEYTESVTKQEASDILESGQQVMLGCRDF